MSLEIRWGKQRSVSGIIAKIFQTTLHFDIVAINPLKLQFSHENFEDVTLKQVKRRITELTTIPEAGIKLIFGGAVLREDSYTLKRYGLKPGSALTLLGTVAELAAAKMRADSEPTPQQREAEMMRNISEVLAKSKALETEVDNFENSILESISLEDEDTPASTSAAAALKKTHIVIGEQLMQGIMKLDNILPDSEFTVAKGSKKAAIREIQALLDRLDKAAGGIDSVAN